MSCCAMKYVWQFLYCHTIFVMLKVLYHEAIVIIMYVCDTSWIGLWESSMRVLVPHSGPHTVGRIFWKKPAAFGRLRNWHPLFPGGAFSCNNTGMNKTITLTDQQHSLLLDLFSSIADLDLQEHCDDSSEFDSLWDAVIDAKDDRVSVKYNPDSGSYE